MSYEATRARWQALGTTVELLVSERTALVNARRTVEQELRSVDLACSRFRADSELSRVNKGSGRLVRIENPLLIEALELALRAAELTGGAVDPTVGRALELAGYDRDFALLPAPLTEARATSAPAPRACPPAPRVCPPAPRACAPDPRACASVPCAYPPGTSACPPAPRVRVSRVIAQARSGWRTVELSRERATVRTPAGVKLDLGATAKAWAADRCARFAHRVTGCGVLVSLGGDVSTAGPSPREGWRVHVTDDHRSSPTAPGQTVSIGSGAIATSSTTVRRWQHAGATAHHIIDPFTGRPAREHWRTVSVAAGDCADANIVATAAIVQGARALTWLSALGLPARLVSADGALTRVGAWPIEGERG